MNYDTIQKYELVHMNIILSHKKKMLRRKKRCLDARTNLFYRFEDWLCKERKIKKTKQKESKRVIIAEIITS